AVPFTANPPTASSSPAFVALSLYVPFTWKFKKSAALPAPVFGAFNPRYVPPFAAAFPPAIVPPIRTSELVADAIGAPVTANSTSFVPDNVTVELNDPVVPPASAPVFVMPPLPLLIPPAVTVRPVPTVTVPVKLAALEIVCPFTSPLKSTDSLLAPDTCRSSKFPLAAPLVLLANISALPLAGLAEFDTLNVAAVPAPFKLNTPEAELVSLFVNE